MQAWRSAAFASTGFIHLGSDWTSSRYSGRRESRTTPERLPRRVAGTMRSVGRTSSGVQKLPPSRSVSPPSSTHTYAIFALSSVVAASAIARNAASLSVADVMRRVSLLRVVRRSARSSACRNRSARGPEASLSEFAGFGGFALPNVEGEPRVRLAEGLFDGSGRVGAGEDESEILPALGERDHVLARVHRDRDFVDAVDRPGLLDAPHRDEPTRAGDRDHHDARRTALALERLQRAAEGVADDQLLEAQAGSEAKRARAQPADRARGDLQDEGPALVEAQLGVDRSLREAEGSAGVAGHRGDAGLRRLGQPRRRDVDRLLEERAVEWVGLVEERQDVERSADQ